MSKKLNNQDQDVILLGVKTHNLDDIDVKIPANSLTGVCGVSGSGKSSLVFDTIYAESYRRYIDSLSSYARSHLKSYVKPKIKQVKNLKPSIAIKQVKSTNTSSASNVGTITEISVLLQHIFAYQASAYCPDHGYIKLIEDPKSLADEITDDIKSLDFLQSKATKHRMFVLVNLTKVMGQTKELKLEYFEQFFLLLKQQGLLNIAKFAEKPEQNFAIDNSLFLHSHEEILQKISSIKYEKFLDEDQLIDLLATCYIIVDRFNLSDLANFKKTRLESSLESSMSLSSGQILIAICQDHQSKDSNKSYHVAKLFFHLIGGRSCRKCGFSVPKATLELFNSNIPASACKTCQGRGIEQVWNWDEIFARRYKKKYLFIFFQYLFFKELSIKTRSEFRQIILDSGIPRNVYFKDLSKKQQDFMKYGELSNHKNRDSVSRLSSIIKSNSGKFCGMIGLINKIVVEENVHLSSITQKYAEDGVCSDCHGSKLSINSLSYKIDNYNFFQVHSKLDLFELSKWLKKTIFYDVHGDSLCDVIKENLKPNQIKPFDNISFDDTYLYYDPKKTFKNPMAELADAKLLDNKDLIINHSNSLKETYHQLFSRLTYLIAIGVGYLSLSRTAKTLSGGELQRINMARCLGSNLSHTMYCLDEPTSGLHPLDTKKLLKSMVGLRDQGNTVVVVEHDPYIIAHCDYLLHIGPLAGKDGGQVSYAGASKQIQGVTKSVGTDLKKITKIKYKEDIANNRQGFIEIINASSLNLKGIDLYVPLGKITVICGVSGSGKSSLVDHTLVPALKELFAGLEKTPNYYDNLLENGYKNDNDYNYDYENFSLFGDEDNVYSSLAEYDSICLKACDNKKLDKFYNCLNVNNDNNNHNNLGTTNKNHYLDDVVHLKNNSCDLKINKELLSSDMMIYDLMVMNQDKSRGSSRSSFGSYMNILPKIREIFSKQATLQGQKMSPYMFSTNSVLGSCLSCYGTGVIQQDLSYLGSVDTVCQTCKGKKFQKDVLQIFYKFFNISEVLNMSLSEAYDLFKDYDDIKDILKQAMDLGLSYIPLGQGTSSYSGGEYQRLRILKKIMQIEHTKKNALKKHHKTNKINSKISQENHNKNETTPEELAKTDADNQANNCTDEDVISDNLSNKDDVNPNLWGKSIIIFDEPSCGLSEYDIEFLWKKFNMLKAQGHTVVIVEHHTGLIKAADWLVEIGPYASEKGGEIIYQGPAENINKNTAPRSLIRQFL